MNDAEAEIEEFFDIESDLRDFTEAGVATPDVTDVDSGLVMAVERVSTTAVPDEYPIRTTGERALAIEVEFDHGTKTTAFLDWPDDGNDLGQIETLLEATGVSFDSFADIYGEHVPLDVRDGYVVIPVDTPAPSGSVTNDAESEEPFWDFVATVVLSVPWTWAAFEFLAGNGLTAVGWSAWAIVAFFLLGAAEHDRKQVAATTDWLPSSWWPFAIAFCPPVALPVYSLRRFSARSNR